MPNLTLTTSGASLPLQNFTNGGSISIAVFSDSNNSTTGASVNVSTNGAAVTVDKTTVYPGASGSNNDFTITAPSVTGNYSISVIQSVKVGQTQTIYTGTVSGTVSSSGGGGGVTAPVIGSVTHNNAASSSVTATVNLSSNGSGGTLQYAQTTSNSAPSSGWQSGSTFSHPRGVTRYYWARRSTSAVTGSTALTVAGVSYTLTAPTSINEGSSGTCTISTVGVPNNTTLYWGVQPSTDFSTNQGSVTVSSNAASFSLTPSADTSTEGAETATVVLYTDSSRTNNVDSDTFTINDTSTGGSGGGSGSTGGGSGANASYGLEIKSQAASPSAVYGVNFRAVNIQVFTAQVISGNGGTASFTNLGPDATDSSKLLCVVDAGWFSSSGTFPVSRSTANGGTITVTNNRSSNRNVTIIIIRIA